MEVVLKPPPQRRMALGKYRAVRLRLCTGEKPSATWAVSLP
jgi:hypothetical protein